MSLSKGVECSAARRCEKGKGCVVSLQLVR
jgi:hypothetical protein